MSAALADAVQRAVQVTIANQVAGFLVVHIPYAPERALITVAASVLAVDVQSRAVAWATTAHIVGDLTIAVASSTLLGLLSVDGANSLPLTLTHACLFLVVGEVVAQRGLGALGESALINAQYMFAGLVQQQLSMYCTPLLALVAAGMLSVVTAWEYWSDTLLSKAFALAAIGVFRTSLLGGLPPALQLPSVVGLACFFKPFSDNGGTAAFGGTVYSYALYQGADSLQSALVALMPIHTALLTVATLALIAPTHAYEALTQIAAVSLLTLWVLQGIQQAANSDPFLALFSIMIAVRVLLHAVQG